MQYYSDELKKLFKSEKELKDAEKAAKDLAINKEPEGKRTLAKNVEEADVAVDFAYTKYEEALKQAAEILRKANEEATKIRRDAAQEVRKAEATKKEAIRCFNEKYGPYTKIYSGDKALKEYHKAVDRLTTDFIDAFLFLF